jgi:hypothetical protein
LSGFFIAGFAVEEIYSLDDIEKVNVVPVTQIQAQEIKPIEISVVFDWLDLSVAQREDNIEKYKNLLFKNNTSRIYFEKNEFKKEFSKFFKDKEYKLHYMLANNGVTEDEDAKYCAFYYKHNTLVMYAIQYKNDPKKAFYYTAFGKLHYADIMSDEYPDFPYSSMQYNRKGQLKSAIYFVSKDIQYMFNSNKEFLGIWYKDKMYDKNGKQLLTRTNW